MAANEDQFDLKLQCESRLEIINDIDLLGGIYLIRIALSFDFCCVNGNARHSKYMHCLVAEEANWAAGF